MKAKKLFPKDYQFLQLKIDYLYQFIKSKFLNDKIKNFNRLIFKNKKVNQKTIEDITINDIEEKLNKIEGIKKIISRLNEPQIEKGESTRLLHEIINEIKNFYCEDSEGKKIEIISTEEKHNLETSQGSLSEKEKKEIENHVVYSYRFTSQIPWSEELKNIPDIIYKHHEKLDGSGYPQGLKGKKNIPIQSRMITITDIYDALTAADRPYKDAVTHLKALEILRKDALNNKIDKDILDLFINDKIYLKAINVSPLNFSFYK